MCDAFWTERPFFQMLKETVKTTVTYDDVNAMNAQTTEPPFFYSFLAWFWHQ